MSAIQVSISIESIMKCVSWIANDFERQKDPLLEALSSRIDNLGTMIEERYRSPLKTFRDFIELNRFDKAVDSLMDASNWEGTPIINFLLGSCLVKIGKKELGQKKITNALNMNPILALLGGCNTIHELYDSRCDFIPWSCVPYTLKDTFKNKVLRVLLGEVNEGISSYDFCTIGGNIAFVLRVSDMNRSIYGLINACNGDIIWRNIVEDKNEMTIVLSSPRYIVYEKGKMYYVSSSENGNVIATFTKDTFHTIFCPENILKDSRIKEFSTSGSMVFVPDAHNYNRIVRINVIDIKKHKYYTSEGITSSSYYPARNVETIEYWAKNIELKSEFVVV